MFEALRRGRFGRTPRRTVLAAALVAGAVALVVPAAGLGNQASSSQACQLSVFSWWTGGGEAAGLDEADRDLEQAAIPTASSRTRRSPAAPARTRRPCSRSGSRRSNPPDSFQGHAGAELRDYIKAGQVEPVDFIYKKYRLRQGRCPKSLINQIRYNGQIYSVPVNIHRANVLWYNPKVAARRTGSPRCRGRGPQFITALEKAKTPA